MTNLGISLGAVLAGWVVQLSTLTAYQLMVAGNAIASLVAGAILFHLPPVTPVPAPSTGDRSVVSLKGWSCAGRRPGAPRWFAFAAWHDATGRSGCARGADRPQPGGADELRTDGRVGGAASGYLPDTVSASRHRSRPPRGAQAHSRKGPISVPRPAQYHLILLPDGAWETVECLAAMICRHATVPTVNLDSAAVERLNIDTLAILVRKAMRLRSAGGEPLLAGPTPAVRKLIERTGTGCLSHTPPGWAAAVRHLARDGRTWQYVLRSLIRT
ncbi:hypothetical protein [Streptomyces rugosispiralis]|uniref:STAS domain-containing protein n=1 Tax=Streptomyces rugosispiralis TaxID=2967341 RepID=A0ABT1V7C9_9ACTN|nr:hypothetical protein [Streptomyces rugosispiralis]MCQ8193272.1 hypothetical protein [Streptomyces rugosispiralis]